MRRHKWDFILILLLLTIFIILIYIVIRLNDDGYKCISDPLSFGVARMEELNNLQLSCSCMADKKGMAVMYFNSTSKWYVGMGGKVTSLNTEQIAEVFDGLQVANYTYAN